MRILPLWIGIIFISACSSGTSVTYSLDGGNGGGGTQYDGKIVDSKRADGGSLTTDSKTTIDQSSPASSGFTAMAAGTFTMGSPSTENCRGMGELQHQVTLTHAFEIMITEVTQGAFQTAMGYNNSKFKSCGEKCPVENVSWSEAAAYCNALSTAKGYTACYTCNGSLQSISCGPAANYSGANIYQCPGYRLPTEAEWEYAYRAGSTSALHNNLPVYNCTATDNNANAISWNNYNSQTTTHQVAGKTANSIGIYDMAGNAAEWVNDFWDHASDYSAGAATDPPGQATASYHAVRGGSFEHAPSSVRAAARLSDKYSASWTTKPGFRCVRTKN